MYIPKITKRQLVIVAVSCLLSLALSFVADNTVGALVSGVVLGAAFQLYKMQ